MSRIFAALIFIASLAPHISLASTIRVRMQMAKDQVSISGMNLHFRTETQSTRLSSGIRPVSIQSIMSSVVLKPETRAGVSFWTLVEKASGRIVQNFSGDRVELQGEMLRIGLMPAPAKVEFVVNREKKTARADVIATMDIDEYLAHVLPHEMSADWPLEALKAQAVASRTYALNRIQMRERQGKLFHVENSVLDQVFNWREPSSITQGKLKNVKLAISETRGEVLEDSAGQVIAAYFHADCGGRTEEPAQVWGSNETSLGTAVDVACPFTPSAKWNWTVRASDLYSKFKSRLKLPAGSEITSLEVDKLSGSGRVARLAMVLGNGERRILSGNDLRSGLGFDKLKSTKFELSRGPEGEFSFAGQGHGHGAGLCQWGSRRLASAGANYRKILAHYYPRAVLKVSN